MKKPTVTISQEDALALVVIANNYGAVLDALYTECDWAKDTTCSVASEVLLQLIKQGLVITASDLTELVNDYRPGKLNL